MKGVKSLSYYGGVIQNRGMQDIDGFVWFAGVKIEYARVTGRGSYWECRFENCDFTERKLPTLYGCKFENCNFTGTDFGDQYDEMTFLEGNVFVAGNEPKNAGADWRRHIAEVDAPPPWMDDFYITRDGELAKV
jgi:hypothetical protein